ncbi:MAG: FAD binding domain-containing protein [Spirochaetales bacterium]
MIPFDVEYIQASSLEDAVAAWAETKEQGKSARYFGGGTELVTAARDGKLTFNRLIDVKRVPELARCDPEHGALGAATRLTTVREQTALPLLARCAGGIADRTVRNSITLGGNLLSMLPYRETALPLLLFDATLELYGPNGHRTVAASEIYNKRFVLASGELLVAVHLAEPAPTYYERITKDARVDYPLATVALALVEGRVRLAFTGACGYPVRSDAAEAAVNEGSGSAAERAGEAVAAVTDRFWEDIRGGAEYRKARLVGAIARGLVALEDAEHE